MLSRSAFTLVEVVIAVGVFALGVGAILGVLPGLLREQETAHATLAALRMPDGIQTELKRIAGGHLDTLKSQLNAPGSETSGALRLAADRNGSDVRALSSDDDREQYFLVELFRFPDGTVPANLASAVAVRVRVSWPFRIGAGDERVETPAVHRESVEFNLVVNR